MLLIALPLHIRFLLAQFHMDSISTKTKIKGVREALESLPSKLNDSYDKVMERIQSHNDDFSKLALRVLLWVSHTFAPLSLAAIRLAVAIEPGTTCIEEEDLDDENIMLSVCAGLVVFDKQTDTVRLVRKFISISGLPRHRYGLRAQRFRLYATGILR